MGIVLGWSSLSLQCLTVIPRVIDSDYTVEIQVMISPPTNTQQIQKDQIIAQLLLLPYCSMGSTATQADRGNKGFGSSDLVFWVQETTQKRPMKTLKVNGKNVVGLLDTGADVSCIAGKDWPNSWPTQTTANELEGPGKAPSVVKISQILSWQEEEGHQGTFQPYIISSLSLTLWG